MRFTFVQVWTLQELGSSLCQCCLPVTWSNRPSTTL